MKLKEKNNILNMTFDNMKMSDERAEEIIKKLINYNTELENKEEEENMKEKKKAVGENLHEISPNNSKNSRLKNVFGSVCVLAAAALIILVWNSVGINNRGNKHVAGYMVQDEETTDEVVSKDNNSSSEDHTTNEDTVFYVETGKNEELSSVIIPNPSSKDLIYEVENGNISMKLKTDFNYNIYSRETDEGLEMLAVGVRKEGDVYTYVYSRQLKTNDDDNMTETAKIPDDATAETKKMPNNADDSSEYPSFVGVSFTAGEKYIGKREGLIEELTLFYNTVNEFIDGREPEVSYKQNNIDGELGRGVFEYKVLEDAEASYVTCGIKDPIGARLEGYFMYMDGKIGGQ